VLSRKSVGEKDRGSLEENEKKGRDLYSTKRNDVRTPSATISDTLRGKDGKGDG